MNPTISNEIYFLVTTNDNGQFAFSSLLFQTKNDNCVILQALTDLHWSFQLPKKTVIHQLYKYHSIPKTTFSDYKVNIFKKFIRGNMKNFELICDFYIDPNQQPFLSFKNRYLKILEDTNKEIDQTEFFYDYILTLHVKNEKYSVKMDYDAHIYNDCGKIKTLISHPFISIVKI